MNDRSLLDLERKLDAYDAKERIANKFVLKPSITKVGKSTLLSNAKDFISKFKLDTQEILVSNERKKQVNIESETNDTERHIEMDLQLGIFDIKPKANEDISLKIEENEGILD